MRVLLMLGLKCSPLIMRKTLFREWRNVSWFLHESVISSAYRVYAIFNLEVYPAILLSNLTAIKLDIDGDVTAPWGSWLLTVHIRASIREIFPE